MTDNEIIRALECIASDKDVLCKGCSYNKYYLNRCHKENAKDAIALINRQKAEIERLVEHTKDGIELAKQLPETIKLAKAEVIKEFAERLKQEFPEGVFGSSTVRYMIDNLVKEMVGDVG